MRLKSVFISQYKNLKNFTLSFGGTSFIDVFVGKNGSGKSNLFEALIEIFRHLDQLGRGKNDIAFDYRLKYEIEGQDIEIEWSAGKLRINQDNDRKTLGKTPFPKTVVVYYSGHNTTVTSLAASYRKAFRRRIYRGVKPGESRLFVEIGPGYKALFLAVMLTQSGTSTAKSYVKQRLNIASIGKTLQVGLKRPFNANARLKALGNKENSSVPKEFDPLDPTTRYWGADSTTQEFIEKLINCIKGDKDGFSISELYSRTKKQYRFDIDVDLFQQLFKDVPLTDVFRQFDNLKTLGMLADITLPLTLNGGLNADITHFSDGQFQSIYIYSIVELFKDRNCLVLLDEPDAFLHPEWQFDFLRQVRDISDTTAKTSHVLMSSHSASTITSANESVINLFEFDGDRVELTKVNKAEVIKSLSAGLITFSETEARLNIQHVLKNTSGPVLFTEGITDEMILETAWAKLYPTEKRRFEIQNAFSCGFQRILVKDNALYQNHPGRTFFSLFDFDEAYNDWNQLGDDVQTNPNLCLAKKRATNDSYALLLPVPAAGQIRHQVINALTGVNYGNKSLLTIELLFHGVGGLDAYFTVDAERPGGFIKFVSDRQKMTFARDVVPAIDAAHFEVFRPIFNFIQSKCI